MQCDCLVGEATCPKSCVVVIGSSCRTRSSRWKGLALPLSRHNLLGFECYLLQVLQMIHCCRQPYSAAQHVQLETLSRTLACLLSEEGFADQPVGGCPVGTSVDPEQVGRIVQGVLAELKSRGLA